MTYQLSRREVIRTAVATLTLPAAVALGSSEEPRRVVIQFRNSPPPLPQLTEESLLRELKKLPEWPQYIDINPVTAARILRFMKMDQRGFEHVRDGLRQFGYSGFRYLGIKWFAVDARHSLWGEPADNELQWVVATNNSMQSSGSIQFGNWLEVPRKQLRIVTQSCSCGDHA